MTELYQEMNRYKTVLYSEKYRNFAHDFHSGNSSIDSFLRDEQSLKKWFGKTFIWLDRNLIVGFYNIGVGYIRDRDYSNYKIGGSVHLNYFAVNQAYRNAYKIMLPDNSFLKTSDILLNDMLQRVDEIRNNWLGFSFVTLSSTERGYPLYKRNNFDELEDGLEFDNKDDEDNCIQMYLCLDSE